MNVDLHRKWIFLSRLLTCLGLAVMLFPISSPSTSAEGDVSIELVKDISPGSEDTEMDPPRIIGNRAFFVADDGVHGFELWTSDGTGVGTYLVRDIAPGSASSSPKPLINLNGKLIFFAAESGERWQLWVSDGTEAGTNMIVKSEFAANGIYPDFQPVVINNSVVFDGYIYDDAGYHKALWSTDGTEAGTAVIYALPAGNAFLRALRIGKNRAYFLVMGSTSGEYVGVTDGTPEGTGKLVVLDQSPQQNQFARVGDTLYMLKRDLGDVGIHLWKYDLITKVGTFLHTFPYSAGNNWYEYIISDIVSSPDGTVYFVFANIGSNPIAQIWKSNGTQEGTQFVFSDPAYREFWTLVWHDPYLYFIPRGNQCGLARTTGAPGNILTLLHQSTPNMNWCPEYLYSSGDSLFYATYGWDWVGAAEDGLLLWKTSGTTETTAPIKKLSGPEPLNMESALYYGKAYFLVREPANSTTGIFPIKLWRSDGTPSGTYQLEFDGADQDAFNRPDIFGVLGGRLVFAASDQVSGHELRSVTVELQNKTFIPQAAR